MAATKEPVSVDASDEARPRPADSACSLTQHQLQLITDSVHAHVGYVGPDLHYRFVNRAHEDTYGLRRTEIVGRHVSEMLGQHAFAEAKPDFDRALAG